MGEFARIFPRLPPPHGLGPVRSRGFRGTRAAPSLFLVIPARVRGVFARRSSRAYLVALIASAVVYAAEQIVADADARCVLADLAWTAAALGAVLGTAGGFWWAERDDRLAWLGFPPRSLPWVLGQLPPDAAGGGGGEVPSPPLGGLR